MNAPVAVKKPNQRSASQNSPGEVRAAYPYFHEKRTKNSAGKPFLKKDGSPNPRNSATFMFPKTNADPYQCTNYMFLWGLAVEAAQKMWPQNVGPDGKWVWPQGAQFAVKDGDVPIVPKAKPGQPVPSADEIAKKNAWRKGHWIVEAENFLEQGPRIAKVVNGQVADLPAKIINGVPQYKSGDYGFVNVHAYAYENETFGVNFGFDGFLFAREGELIGSSGPKSAAQMFGNVAGMAASLAPAMPAGPAPGAPGMPGPQSVAPMPPAAPAAPAAPMAPPAGPTLAPPPPGMPTLPPLPQR